MYKIKKLPSRRATAMLGFFLFLGGVFSACEHRQIKETPHGVIVNVAAPKKDSCQRTRNVRLEVINNHIIRVSATAASRFSDKKSLMASFEYPAEKNWSVNQTENGTTILSTSALRAIVSKDGTVCFTDADGHPILSEKTRTFLPMTDPQADRQGKHKQAYTIRQMWNSDADEGYYGLGQHQSDEFNYKGRNEQLFQYNTKVSVPFVVSSRGYGILWDNNSLSRWGDARDYSRLDELFVLYDEKGERGGLTGTYSNRTETLVRQEPFLGFENEQANRQLLPSFPLDGANVTFEGYLEPATTGNYQFLLYYAGYVRVEVDGAEVVGERWRTAWNPNSFKFCCRFEKGRRAHILVEWKPDGSTSYCGLRALLPKEEEQDAIAFWSEMGDEIDYYFVDGHADEETSCSEAERTERQEKGMAGESGLAFPTSRQREGTAQATAALQAWGLSDLDRTIAGYRTITGKAQVMPKWAIGFWQSRERYRTSEEILSVLSEFRRRHLPIDNIVQDWFYWKEDAWGSHEFDPDRYPDPKAMIDSIHAMNGHYMLSVWPKFYCTTEHFREFDERGWMYRQAIRDSIRDWVGKGYVGSFYDAYSEEARRLFWQQMNEHLYSKFPIDAWWMDASEPNVRDCQEMSYLKALCSPTALGSSTEYLLAYALMNAEAIYTGQRSVNPDRRVFLLTRNGFAGLQRYSTAVWSGDIGTRWEDMKAQISAGINFSLSGIPFWGMDIGGFCVEKRFERAWRSGAESDDLAEWRELQTRWFQFGAFVPLFRVHGQYPPREPWLLAPESHPAYKSWEFYARLRYRLMPYIYSLCGMTHFVDYTMMRALVMDYADDAQALDVGDQFLCGPSLMVSPVCKYGAREREVYLPVCEGGWYDFYTGAYVSDGGCRVSVSAPYERIPLQVPAGAVIPMGPDMEYSDEKPLQEVDLLVYGGHDGSFVLYEDDGVDYDYEKGWYSMIPISFDNSAGTLTLGARQGQFPQSAGEKHFRVTLFTPAGARESTFTYAGEPLTVPLSQ